MSVDVLFVMSDCALGISPVTSYSGVKDNLHDANSIFRNLYGPKRARNSTGDIGLGAVVRNAGLDQNGLGLGLFSITAARTRMQGRR